MKKAMLFIAVAVSALSLNAQTVYVPNGTSGIGTSSNGNVGVGTSSPAGKFHVYGGDAYLWGLNLGFGNSIAKITTDDASKPLSFQIAGTEYMRLSESGFLGIGITPSDGFKLKLKGIAGIGQWTNGTAVIDAYNGLAFYGCNTASNGIAINSVGSVGIGTTAPDQKLTVKGKIHAEEVIVDLNVPLADYVFGKDYELMPLHQVDQYVQENSHLPDMPSATEVKEKGMGVGEMQNKMLQKIEELTLYVIQQDKRIKALEEENQRLKK
jgi:hypothetical protein